MLLKKVVITDSSWEDDSVERGVLEEAGAEVASARCKTPEEVIEACRDADALLVGWAPINRNVLRELPRCRLLMRFGAGYDNIDVKAATEAGMAVAINADYCVEEVATHALSLLLACHRQLFPLARAVEAGTWDPFETMRLMPPLSKQTLGIVGFGRIGRRLLGITHGLFQRTLVYDPLLEQQQSDFTDVEFVSLERVLADSDFVSIHAPLTPATRHLISRDGLARMKPGAYLVNCARGPLVDETALVEALREKRIAGAGLDVFSQEPLPMDHPLRSFANVVVTPHAAALSEQALYLLKANPARAIVKFFRGEPIPLVNPEVSLRS